MESCYTRHLQEVLCTSLLVTARGGLERWKAKECTNDGLNDSVSETRHFATIDVQVFSKNASWPKSAPGS